jgi:hypothetical protein
MVLPKDISVAEGINMSFTLFPVRREKESDKEGLYVTLLNLALAAEKLSKLLSKSS